MATMQNVTIGIGPFVLSLTQEEHNKLLSSVAVIRNAEFVPARFWSFDRKADGDTESYVGAGELAVIISNVMKLADFAEYMNDSTQT